MALPAAAISYAKAHHGVLPASILEAAGMAPRTVRRRAEKGALTRLHPGVYAIAGLPPTWEQNQLAACFSTRGVASHRAALRLWLPQLVRETRNWPVEVTVPAERRIEAPGVIVHRSRDLDPATVTHRQHIPITDPLRMLADLCCVLEHDELARVVDECVVSRLLTLTGVRAARDRAAVRRARGVSRLHAVVENWPVGERHPDSGLELRFARLCPEAGLPEPVFQYELTLGGSTRRLDFAFPDLRVAIEVDGFEVRTNRKVFQDERRRQNDLVLDRWTVPRFTWHDITHDPASVVARLKATLVAVGRPAS